MASNNILANPMNSSSARKHQNSAAFSAAIRRMFGTHKKHQHHRHYYSGHSSPVNFGQGFTKSDVVSARKLAAGLWHLRFMEVSGDGAAACGDGSFRFFMSHRSELAHGNVKITFPHCHNSGEKFRKTKGLMRRPVTILHSRNGLRCELESSLPCLKCSKEEATKWDPALAEPSNEFTKINSRKLLEDRKLVGDRDSVVTALVEELLRAQRSINKLKASHKSSKKKVKQFLQNLEEEKIHWKHREYHKIQAMLDDLKDKLARERRSRERMELLNTKLVHELAEANLSAKEFMTNYEKEKKERELTMEVCNQLAMQIGEDRANLEELLRDSMKLREEVEEEKKMMKMAELWCKERVQMKLVDAKLVLEDKYNQLVQLIGYLEMFLRSRGAEFGTNELEETQLIKQVVESINIQRIVELSYDFSKSDDIFTIYEEFRKDNASERVINPDFLSNFTSPLSTIHIVTLDEEGLNKKSVLHESSPSSDCNTVLEQTKGQKFVAPPQRREYTYLINVNQDNNILGREAECSEKLGLKSLKNGVIGACTVSAGHIKCRISPASKLLRSCRDVGTTSSSAKASRPKRQGDGWYKHKDSVASTSPCKGSGECSFRHSELLGQRNSKDTMNPHIARGMRGCIEWPKGIPKANSKVIPLEERVRSQKSQLQNILKHKA